MRPVGRLDNDEAQVESSYHESVGWVGSIATSLESRAALLDDLGTCDDPNLMAYLPEAKMRLRQAIEWHRQMETATDKQADERFEW